MTNDILQKDTIKADLGFGVDYYKGADGKDGMDGKTPVKGVDYFTPEDVEQIENQLATPATVDKIGGIKLGDGSTKSGVKDTFMRKGQQLAVDDNKPDTPFITYASNLIPGVVQVNEGNGLEYSWGSISMSPATSSTLGTVKPDGTTITVDDNGVLTSVGGGAEPDAYIKDASVSGNTLTLIKKDDTNVVFTSAGGSGSGVSGYAFTSSQTFTDEDKIHLKEAFLNNNIHITIDELTVIRILSTGNKIGYVVINTNGVFSNQVQVYSVDIDKNSNVRSSTSSIFMTYYLVGNSSTPAGGDVLTAENWMAYITFPTDDWQYTTNLSESNLYNAKELIIFLYNPNYGATQQYYNFNYDMSGNSGCSLGNNFASYYFRLPPLYNQPNWNYDWYYDGSSITITMLDTNCKYILLYKT